MTAQDPVCHIPPVTTTTQPGPVSLPSIPPAQPTVASLTATVNALRQVVLFLSGQQGPRGLQGAPGQDAHARPARWTEQGRTTSKTKVYQNNDPSTGNFVEVEQINSLTMQDGITGESWRWSR